MKKIWINKTNVVKFYAITTCPNVFLFHRIRLEQKFKGKENPVFFV